MSAIPDRDMPRRLIEVAPELDKILTQGVPPSPIFDASEISHKTVMVTMRDGIRLATDVYLPPVIPAPAVAMRTPYDRAQLKETFMTFAQGGYVVISQDCRGTGDSEPDVWDYYMYEREDSLDFVEWVIEQEWFNGFLGSCGGSYCAQTQWCMAMHPHMSATAPEVGGLGIAFHTAHYYMFMNAYMRSVGNSGKKGPVDFDKLEREMLQETLAGGFYNEPLDKPFSEALLERYPHLRKLSHNDGKRWLWENYSALSPQRRAEMVKLAFGSKNVSIVDVEAMSSVFGIKVAHDAHMFPSARESELLQRLHAPPLLITGWYDWGIDDTLATWKLITEEAPKSIAAKSRLLITPSAHNKPGYHEGRENHPELDRNFRTANIVDLLLRWYSSSRENAIDSWPTVIYYLTGANEWYTSSAWPPNEARALPLYLGPKGTLTIHEPKASEPDTYTYDPIDATPTLGGNIVSYVYAPGSVDVSGVQRRPDILTYTTKSLDQSLDIVGPLRLMLYVSSSAVDTDFSARLSDVFPDGRAIQLQSGLLRARYRDPSGAPKLLEPGQIYLLEIDMWSSANRFEAGHCLRLDISSADFPRFDRNTNRAGESGGPVTALQTIYHDPEHPSHLLLSIIGDQSIRD